MSKSGFMKDAVILFAITLISGFLLGGVYQLTKKPIEIATIKANNKAYKAVFNEAETFDPDDSLTAAVEACNTALATMNYGNVAVDTVLKANDANKNQLGYVIVSHSNDSYGGEVKISVGMKEDGTVTGIEFLTISDTPGLGLKYTGKNAEALTVKKGGGAGETEINAISGATITSSAVTNAVNAALYFVHNCINQ